MMASQTPKTFDPEREIADRIIAALEAGTPPWRKPWIGQGSRAAFPQVPAGGPVQGTGPERSEGWGGRGPSSCRQGGVLGHEEPDRGVEHHLAPGDLVDIDVRCANADLDTVPGGGASEGDVDGPGDEPPLSLCPMRRLPAGALPGTLKLRL